MIEWSANPIAFSAWILEVRWYGLVYAAGFLLGYAVLYLAAKNKIISNMAEKQVEDFMLWLMVGSIIGARLFYVAVYNPAYYLSNPLLIPAVWQGGLSIHGGLIGAALVTYLFCRKNKISFHEVADILVLPLALAITFGRMANYANAELVGRKTSVQWCVNFPTADGCRHPSQIYEAIYSFTLFWTLLIMSAVKRMKSGIIFWTFISLYGTLRLFTTFFREFDPTDPAIMNLSIGQWLSIGMVVIGIIAIIKINASSDVKMPDGIKDDTESVKQKKSNKHKMHK